MPGGLADASGGPRRFARHVPGRHLATSVPCLGTLISFVRWVRSLRDAFENGLWGQDVRYKDEIVVPGAAHDRGTKETVQAAD